MRWFLFNKKQYADAKLPPTSQQRCLSMQCSTLTLCQALVWKECGIPCPDIPLPTSHGWIQDGNRLQTLPITLLPAPKAVLKLIKCGCRGSCIN
ncbi:unnamed protein product [Porites evermanni]|uniref:Uncharacterized protein n=1 Tax=Porites evermanni TaxID=104178 RepID=A0ABN8LUW5_9CNID|nr:unnamed protein product [Porites evermanni]